MVCLFCLIFAAVQVATAQNQPPQFRLPTFAAPVRYAVTLTLVPDKDTFTGTVDIDLNFHQPSAVLWFNAEMLTVKDATLTAGGRTAPAKVIAQPHDFVGFAFEQPVAAGTAKLHANFEGQISRKDMQGIFQVKDGESWYIYSQFENIAARRAFPCFDEPGYKVPWQVTLNVPKDSGAFSNTPALSEAEGGDGLKTVKFAETKPLPSYLVAIAVGPMDIVPAGEAGAHHTKIRIIVPRGRAAEAQYVATATPDIVNLLEKYFEIPYPYEKLDEVAIPFAGYAMEHPGLVTYGAGFFLSKPQEASLNMKRAVTSVIAHELAHQWFGDLVTTAWWDDIWLNEGFASWTANKIVNEYHPEWKMNIAELNGYQGAMETDELVSARRVRQPILSNDDIQNAFDDITYNKGSALLNMFESYMGPAKFQEGIRNYLHKYAWGNATSTQFLEAISLGNPAIPKAFSTFLDQPGVPLVTAKLKCGAAAPRLELSQKRFLPRGSQGSSNQTWNIPVCVRYPGGSNPQRACTLMTDATAAMDLPHTNSCPTWAYANAEQAGYYVVRYEKEMLNSLLKDDNTLSLPERVGLIGDIAALTKNDMPLGEALALAPKFAHDQNRPVVTKTLAIVGGLRDHLVPKDLEQKYQRYLTDLFKPRALQLGWNSKPGEDDDARLLRPTLFGVLADQAQDSEFIAHAKELAESWLSDHRAVDPDLAGIVLAVAARHGDSAFFDRLHAQARKETQENFQRILLRAMGSFRDAAIMKRALSLILSGEFDNRQSIAILFAAAGSPETRDFAYEFVKQNWDALIAKLPNDFVGFLPFVAGNYCDAQHRADVEAFFKDRVTTTMGGPRNLQQVLEGINICIANKQANEASVVDFLKNY
jgi:alanyl aminopeptidase